jgi:hypothetical protein
VRIASGSKAASPLRFAAALHDMPRFFPHPRSSVVKIKFEDENEDEDEED